VNLNLVGHYTQIVNSGVSRIGCGAAIVDDYVYAYCNYAQAQFDIRKPYVNGTSCSSCTRRNCRNNLCNCKKICQNYGKLDPVKCKCECPLYATGDECEKLVCSGSDQQYGCSSPNNQQMCSFANTIGSCPHTCGTCSYTKTFY
jgi:hypothetical protein